VAWKYLFPLKFVALTFLSGLSMRNTFKALFQITDYRIRSRKILLGVLVGLCLLTGLTLVAELTIDLLTTSTPVISIFFLLSVLLFLAFTRWSRAQWIASFGVALPYILLMVMFWANPKNFHTMGFWMVLIPLIALLLQGMRSAWSWCIVVILTYFANGYYIDLQYQGEYEIIVHKTPYIVTHLIFLGGIFAAGMLIYKLLGDAYAEMKNKSEELHILQENIQKKKDLLEQYQSSLIALNRNETIFKNNLQEIYRLICATAAVNLNTNRVSIWLLENRNTILVRKYLYEKNNESDEIINLTRRKYPAYFKALENKSFIVADHARTHEDTVEFLEHYLKPLNIHSLLDCPIIINQESIGVICCENQGEVRIWHPEEVLYIQSLADIISMCYQNERIKQLLKQIRNQNYELVEKTHSIETMNEELTAMNEELVSLNDQLANMNDGLEAAVKNRTHELEVQNKQLTEYAFINSHLLRAPLARILGLSQLIIMETTSARDQTLLAALQSSSMELDQIIRKISELLYAGNNISREDINQIVSKSLSADKLN